MLPKTYLREMIDVLAPERYGIKLSIYRDIWEPFKCPN